MRRALTITALTLFAFIVHGYHPYGEDGGLYLAGIKKLLHPALYPYWTDFVTEHLRFSLFAPFVAGLVRVTHLSLEPVILLLYLAGIWTTLLAGWMLLSRVGATFIGCAGGVALLACWLDLPVAGTSQMLMDPYVTARTLSTPLTLFAVVWALDWSRTSTRINRDGGLCLGSLLLAALFHPLMAGYALAIVAVVLACDSSNKFSRRWAPWMLLAIAVLGGLILQVQAPAESANYVWIAMTRYYWFPFMWEWYEQIGLFAPLILLLVLLRYCGLAEAPSNNIRRNLIHATLMVAAIALAIAMLFSRAHLSTHLVARMQPLRIYGFVYEVMTLLLGAWLSERVLSRKAWRWVLLLAAFGSLMFYVQRSTYPASVHLELPGRQARNPYVRAFLWVRENTPQDALFALDAHYITREGEDAQPFRAIAERSALADYSKDGGEASITPALTADWIAGQAAQTDLEISTDAERAARLSPLGVRWIVLENSSRTAWGCPYRNATVKVCRLP